jgi:hypothetical protein
MFYIEGELLHKLNQGSQEKKYIVQIGNKKFKYNQIQIALLSPIIFKYFIQHKNPFVITIPSDLNLNGLISSFTQLDSLFHSTNELTISNRNVTLFSYLADFLDHRFLMKKCKKVNPDQAQTFKLSSKHLICFPKSWLARLVDFDLIINQKKIGINFSLFSCICDKLKDLNHQEKQLPSYIAYEYLNSFLSFFDLMDGYSFNFKNTDLGNLKSLIDCFGIASLYKIICSKIPLPETLEDSLQFISQPCSELLETHVHQSLSIIIQNFNAISFDDLNKLSNSHLLQIFSSESLQIENEDYLLQLIIRMIEANKNRLLLLKAVHLEFVSTQLLKRLFENISNDEIDF